MPTLKEYKSQSARDAQKIEYGDESYWEYLDQAAAEHFAKGIRDAYTATLSDVLKGNEGD